MLAHELLLESFHTAVAAADPLQDCSGLFAESRVVSAGQNLGDWRRQSGRVDGESG